MINEKYLQKVNSKERDFEINVAGLPSHNR